mmetsp:Transcript_14578/g.37251  ORF Transcript_14578/g.37251 Transcript_14578/m.37251 type:complete len:303 (-) Transcript_14578:1565-2473(-)
MLALLALVLSLTATLLVLGSPHNCNPFTVGTTDFRNKTHYNSLILGQLSARSSRLHHRTFVAGDTHICTSHLGKTLYSQDCDLETTLTVAKGDLRLQDSKFHGANAVYYKKLRSDDNVVLKYDSELIKGDPDFPPTFPDAKADIYATSKHFLANFPTNGEIVRDAEGSTLQLLARPDCDGKFESIYTFNLVCGDLEKFKTLYISAPKRATVLINIPDRKVDIKGLIIDIDCPQKPVIRKTLFNFFNADRVKIQDTKMRGNLLVKGELVLRDSGMRGQIVASKADFDGAKVSMARFQGNFCPK